MKLITYKAKEIREIVSSLLNPLFIENGFAYSKSQNWYLKSTGDYDNIFHIVLHNRSDHFSIEVFIYIRQKEVEKELRKTQSNSTEITMGNTLGV